MPIVAFANLTLLVLLSFHICRTGRSKMWLLAIWALPVLGSLIYVLVEMVPQLLGDGRETAGDDDGAPPQRPSSAGPSSADPDARGSGLPWSRRRQGQTPPAPRPVAKSAATGRDDRMFRAPKDPLREGMVHEKLREADRALASHRYDEAAALFASARQGFFADSPDILYGLARAHVGRGDFDSALGLLDELVTARPAYQPHAIAILKARVLAKLGDATAALALLDAILLQTDNLEGRRLEGQYRRAEILWQSGDVAKAASGLNEILRHEKLFRVSDDERHWIRLAGQALQAIS